MPTLLPGRAATLAAVRLVVPLTVLVASTVMVAGRLGGLGAVLGIAACAPSAALTLPARRAAALAGGAVCAVAAGLLCGPVVLSAGSAGGGPADGGGASLVGAALAALVVGSVAAAGVVLTRGAAGASVLWPVATAVALPLGPSHEGLASLPGVFGACAGAVATVALGARLPGRPEPVRLSPDLARRFAVASAAGLGFLTAAGVLAQAAHGYWALLAFTALRPTRGATGPEVSRRVIGTTAGATAAVLLLAALGPNGSWSAAAGPLAAGCLLLSVAWSLRGNARGQYAFVVPALALGVAALEPADAARVITERLSLVGVGAIVAAVASVLLHHSVRVPGTRAGADS